MGMRKGLTAIGSSHGVIIDKPILEVLGIDRDTVLDIEVKDGALVIRPVAGEVAGKRQTARELGRKFTKVHDATFKKLAK